MLAVSAESPWNRAAAVRRRDRRRPPGDDGESHPVHAGLPHRDRMVLRGIGGRSRPSHERSRWPRYRSGSTRMLNWKRNRAAAQANSAQSNVARSALHPPRSSSSFPWVPSTAYQAPGVPHQVLAHEAGIAARRAPASALVPASAPPRIIRDRRGSRRRRRSGAGVGRQSRHHVWDTRLHPIAADVGHDADHLGHALRFPGDQRSHRERADFDALPGAGHAVHGAWLGKCRAAVRRQDGDGIARGDAAAVRRPAALEARKVELLRDRQKASARSVDGERDRRRVTRSDARSRRRAGVRRQWRNSPAPSTESASRSNWPARRWPSLSPVGPVPSPPLHPEPPTGPPRAAIECVSP